MQSSSSPFSIFIESLVDERSLLIVHDNARMPSCAVSTRRYHSSEHIAMKLHPGFERSLERRCNSEDSYQNFPSSLPAFRKRSYPLKDDTSPSSSSESGNDSASGESLVSCRWKQLIFDKNPRCSSLPCPPPKPPTPAAAAMAFSSPPYSSAYLCDDTLEITNSPFLQESPFSPKSPRISRAQRKCIDFCASSEAESDSSFDYSCDESSSSIDSYSSYQSDDEKKGVDSSQGQVLSCSITTSNIDSALLSPPRPKGGVARGA